MNARERLAADISAATDYWVDPILGIDAEKIAVELEEKGYRKPRTIRTAAELDSLPFGSAVQTSDDSDVVVLKAERGRFRNQSGAELSTDDLWRYGTRPFTVLFEPEPTK